MLLELLPLLLGGKVTWKTTENFGCENFQLVIPPSNDNGGYHDQKRFRHALGQSLSPTVL